MSRGMAIVLMALVLMGGCEEKRAWREGVKDVVCLLVGPFNEKTLPPGKTVRQILEDFKPDLAEWSVLHSPKYRKELGSLPYYPPRIMGGAEYEGAPSEKLSAYWQRWKVMFGTPWRAVEEDGVAIDVYGNRVETPGRFYQWRTCHNNPRWHRFQKETILKRVREGAMVVMRQDNIGVPVGITKAGGFCRFCRAKFRDYLKSRLSHQQLKKLGVEDVNTFDIRNYIIQKDYHRDGSTYIEDPLVRHYLFFQYRSNLDAWNDIVESVRRINNRIAVCGNQGRAAMNPYSSIIVSRENDVIFLEHNVPWLFPYETSSAGYKLELAAGGYRKPVWVWDFGYKQRFSAKASAEIFFAECFANGVIPYFLMNNFTGIGKSTVSPETYEIMKRYARFARAHRNLLTRAYRTHARVALVYSIPSFMFKHSGALRKSTRSDLYQEQLRHFTSLARILERSHIPYEVVIFGDGELWDDRDTLEALERYALLILPNVEAMSARQAEAVLKFLQHGGNVLISGKLGERDEFYTRLQQPYLAQISRKGETVLGKGRAFAFGEAIQPAGGRDRIVYGALQQVAVNQKEARSLILSAWSKAEGVLSAGAGYSIWADALHQDGSRAWYGYACFNSGTHDWQRVELKISPEKPIKSLKVYLLLRYTYRGKAWFDDVSLVEEGSEENLVNNPGFEHDSSWKPYYSGFVWDEKQSHSGKRSIRCVISAAKVLNSDFNRAALEAINHLLSDSDRILSTNAPPEIYINPILTPHGLVVHALNYDWREDDTVREKRDIVVRLNISGLKISSTDSATLCSPDFPDMQLPVRIDGDYLEFTIPRLRVWCLVPL